MNRKFFIICAGLFAGLGLFACKKSNGSSDKQVKAGIGYYTIFPYTWETNDTLAPDPLTGGMDLSMWTIGPKSYDSDRVFIYNMPAAASGTFQLTNDPGGLYDTTCYILGFDQGPSGQINFASLGVYGTLTKLGVDSFSFITAVIDDANPTDTFEISGYGSY